MSRLLKVALTGATAVFAFAFLLPRIAGAPWPAIADAWRVLSWWHLALLCLVWAAGLLAHSAVLMGALPGLTRRRALTLNLTGSAISNVLPLGGGLGIGLNYLMVRRWGFTAAQFSLFTVLSNAWTVLAKASLPCVAVSLLVLRDVPMDPRILAAVVGGTAVLILVSGLAVVVVCNDHAAHVVGRGMRLVATFRGTGEHESGVETRILALRRRGVMVVHENWRRMTVGMVIYYALGAVLLWASLHAVGSTLGPTAVLLLFAFERVLTVLPITPGGSGVVEVATTALAITLSGSQERALVAAGVLLYRGFIFGLEIPVGGLWLLSWFVAQRFGSQGRELPAPVALGEAA